MTTAKISKFQGNTYLTVLLEAEYKGRLRNNSDSQKLGETAAEIDTTLANILAENEAEKASVKKHLDYWNSKAQRCDAINFCITAYQMNKDV